jgi:ubiquinone/menaquinone biosynthesis C-methylase UbiE
MDSSSIKDLVQSQFGATAESYVTSAIHAGGDDLARLVELAQLRGDERVLDIATGGGHTALAFARRAGEVVASDLTPEMLRAAERFIGGQGLANVRFELADAEALPFPDDSFDVVTTRIAPHHFPNPQRYVGEVARVLRPAGRFLLDDNMAPEETELAAFMDRFEQWRDPSHVRNYPVSEWRAWIEAAGMSVEHVEPLRAKRYDFADWTARMRMPESECAALERWLLAAPPRCVKAFQIVVEGGRVVSLSGTYGIIVARKS